MFRGRTTARNEAAVVVASPNAIALDAKKNSKGIWKPSLKKLFSKKDITPQESHTTFDASITYPTKPAFEEPKVVSIDKPKHEDDGIVRPISSRRGNAPPDSPKSSKENNSSRRRSFIQTLTLKKSAKDLQKREFQKFFAAKDMEEKGLLCQYREDYGNVSGTAAYVPKHAGADLYYSNRQWASETYRPSTAHEVPSPKETPADANLKRSRSSRAPKDIQTNFAPHPPLPPTPSTAKFSTTTSSSKPRSTTANSPAPLSPTVTIRPTSFEENDDETDFQSFLRESRISATQIQLTKGHLNPIRPLPESSGVMDSILAKRQSVNMERAKSTSHATVATKATKAANRKSFVYSVGDYIKPGRPHTMYFATSAVADDDWKSVNGSIYKSKSGTVKSEKKDVSKRMSMVGVSIKRTLSMSRDRDSENDERARAARALAIKERRRSLYPPTGNQSMNRYNQVATTKPQWV